MKIRVAILCVITAFGSACTAFTPGQAIDESIQPAVSSTDQAVHDFLGGRDLAPIEGAWEHDENSFELVISKNNFDISPEYDYVGIITRTDQAFWENGDIKLLLRSTDTANVFEGLWMTRNKSRREMTFVIENKNLVQASFRSNDGNSFFVRIRRINPRLAVAH
jgi:hypothetical protein